MRGAQKAASDAAERKQAMKRALFFVLGLLLAALLLGACAPSAAPTQPSPSPSYDEFALDRYPLIAEKRPMTDADRIRFNLHRATLGVRTYFFNHYRGLCPKGQVCGKWEWLEAGTEILQDADGRAWYKADCANRLFEPVPAQCPVCKFIGWTPFGGPGSNWPWWLPWFLLLPLLGLLVWLYRRRGEEREWREPPPNGKGNGNGRPDLPGPAAFRQGGEATKAATKAAPTPTPAVDPVAARRAELEREVAVANSKAEAHEAKVTELRGQLDPAGDPDAGITILGQIKAESEKAKTAREAAVAKKTELDALGPAPATPSAPDPVQELEGILENLDDPEKIGVVGDLLQAVRQARYQGKGGKRIMHAVTHVREGDMSAVEADTKALLAIVK